jgi:hypothetical protein
MVDWAWVIPVVALAIWILSQLARGAEARKGPMAQGRRGKTTADDIDRFLEEINRRRQQQQRQQTEEEIPVAQPVRVEPPQRPRPAPPPPRPRPSAIPPPPVRRKPVVAEVIPVAEAVVEVLPVSPAELPPEVPAAMRSPAAKLPPRVTQVRGLLSSSDGIRAAILLTEILGPPRCRRRPGRLF